MAGRERGFVNDPGRVEREQAGRGEQPAPTGYARSESPVMTDGQLGGRIERGPEPANPEGSVDISNVDYRATEERATRRR